MSGEATRMYSRTPRLTDVRMPRSAVATPGGAAKPHTTTLAIPRPPVARVMPVTAQAQGAALRRPSAMPKLALTHDEAIALAGGADVVLAKRRAPHRSGPMVRAVFL